MTPKRLQEIKTEWEEMFNTGLELIAEVERLQEENAQLRDAFPKPMVYVRGEWQEIPGTCCHCGSRNTFPIAPTDHPGYLFCDDCKKET